MTSESLILEELRSLRQQVDTLQQAAKLRHRTTLVAVQPQPWLGQSVTIEVRVTDEAGQQPRVDLPVMVTTTWGALRVADGYTLQEGQSVVARTDLSGAVALTLLPPLADQIADTQQHALETMLAQMDATAPAPNAVTAELNAAVRQYQQASNDALRAAVDFYFQFFYQQRLATLTTQDWLQRWQYTNATVIALATEAPTSANAIIDGMTAPMATVQGAAVLTLRFTDWLGPWLQSYTNLARNEGDLRRQFDNLKELTSNPEELVAATTDLVQASVRNRLGRTGEQIEQQVVYGVVTALLDESIGDLPVATRVKLITGLPPATGAVRTLGSRAQADLGQATFDLKQDLTQRVESSVGQLTQAQEFLITRLSGVEGSVGGLQNAFQGKADRSDLVTLQGQLVELGKGTQTLNGRFDLFQSNFVDLSDSVALFRGDLDRARAEITDFGKFQNEAGSQLVKLGERTDAFQVQFSKLQNDFGRVDSSLDKLQIGLRDVEEELKRRPGRQVFEELQATLSTLSTVVNTLNSDVLTFRDQVNLRLTGVVTRGDLTQLRTELGNLVATKADQKQLERSFTDIDARFRNIQTDFGVFNSNVTRLRGDLDSLGNNVTKIRLDVDRIRPRP